MIAGVATDTIVESTRIMKKPRQRANSAGQGSLRSTGAEEATGWVMAPLNTRGRRLARMSPLDLMAGPPPTHLPEDPSAAELEAGTSPVDVVRRHPASP